MKFPPTGLIFNYYVDPKTKKFLPWSDKVGKFELDPEIPLTVSQILSFEKFDFNIVILGKIISQTSLVSTTETAKIQYFLNLLISKKNPVMLVGGSGFGKTVLMSHKLANLSDIEYGVTNISLNYYSTSGS